MMELYKQLSSQEWLIDEEDGEGKLNRYETIFSLSNGSLGVRGNLEEMPVNSITGTFLGGVFDRDVSWSYDMVNLPNFLELNAEFEGRKLSLESNHIIEHIRKLDMRQGLLYRLSRFKSPLGHTVKWESLRIVSIVHPHLCFERHCFTLEDAEGYLQIAHFLNSGVKTFDSWQKLELNHLEIFESSHMNNVLYSCSKLNEARHPIGAATVMLFSKDGTLGFDGNQEVVSRKVGITLKTGETLVCDRFSTVQSRTHKDDDMDTLKYEILTYLDERVNKGFDALLEEQRQQMNSMWENTDVVIEGDEELQKQIRFSLFHLIQAGPRHNEKASIGAKALTGYRYAGHIFWDTEMFMLPFYVFTDPKTARNILMYRYHMLPGAKRHSAKFYQEGARYPYRSAGTGDEEITMFCPGGWVQNANPFYKVEKWWFSENEVHISSAVAYGIMLYFKAVRDYEFMLSYGLEMLLEISRFYMSYLEWNCRKKRYEILSVMGPDEYHHKTNNNTYTNYMAYKAINWTLELLSEFEENYSVDIHQLLKKIDLTKEEIEQWKRKLPLIYLPEPNEQGIVPQCDGFLDLKAFDKGEQDIIVDDDAPFVENTIGEPVAKIARGQYQCVKQCDTVLLFCLMPDIFSRDVVLKNFDFYERRTYHMSSLSPNTASIVALRLDKGENAYKYLNLSSTIDLKDVQGNTKDGIHSAAAGGTWMASVYGFGGVTLNKNFELELMPKLPEKWRSLRYTINWHGSLFSVMYDGKTMHLKLLNGGPVEFMCKGRRYTLRSQLSIGA